jgi:two-component system, sensor histidine kinase
VTRSHDQQRVDHSLEVSAALLRRALDQWPILVAINTLGPLVTSAAIWNLVDHRRLLWWLSGTWVSVLLGLGLALHYRRQGAGRGHAQTRNLQRWLVLAAAAHGLCAGLMIPLFLGDHARLLTLLPAVTLTVAGLATIALHAHLASMLAMLAGVLSPTWIAVLMGLRPEATPAIINIPFAFGALAIYGRSAHRTLRELLSLRLENSWLLLQQAHRRQQAERSERSKSQLLAVASHDLRQPLQGLLLQLEALQLRLSALPEIAQFGERATRTAKVLNELLDGLLALSNVDTNQPQVQRSTVDLSELLQQLASEYGDRARARGLSLRLHAAPGLRLNTDALLLARALRNLLENALRYTQRGTLLLAARRRRDYLRIEVWDTGIGIARKDQERILDRYYRVVTPSGDAQSGLGLGLALVRRIAEVLGAKLDFQSRPGQGSVFMLSLLADQPTAAKFDDAGLCKGEQPAPTILLIDSNSASRNQLAAQMDRWGAVTLLVTDLADALLTDLAVDTN